MTVLKILASFFLGHLELLGSSVKWSPHSWSTLTHWSSTKLTEVAKETEASVLLQWLCAPYWLSLFIQNF